MGIGEPYWVVRILVFISDGKYSALPWRKTWVLGLQKAVDEVSIPPQLKNL